MKGSATVPLVTGMLIERHRIDPAAARALLERVARDHGIDEAVLAAAVIALLAPGEPSSHTPTDRQTGWGIASDPSASEAASPREEGTDVTSVEGGAAGAVELSEKDGSAVAQLIADLTGARPDRTVIYAVGEDSSLRLVGNVGTPVNVVRAWRTLPLVLDLPLCASVRQQRPIFLESAMEIEREYPATRGSREGTEAWASIPIVQDSRVTGVVGLSWCAPVTLDEVTRDGIIHAVEGAGQVMVRILSAGAAELGMLAELLDLIPDSWVVLAATGTAEGSEFLVEAVAPSLPETWLGAALLDLFPGLERSRDLLIDLQQVLRSGAPLARRISTTRPGGPPWEERGAEVRIVRSGHRIVLTWR